LVTSPWDQERIFSGLAKLIRIESKSAIRLARSYGLLRYKVVSSLPGFHRGRDPVFSTEPAENPKNQNLQNCEVLPVGAQHAAPLQAWFQISRRLSPLAAFAAS
jgi:hypothetical protein